MPEDINLHIHVHHSQDSRVDEIFRAVQRVEQRMTEGTTQMATFREELRADLAALVTEVEQTRTATDAVAVVVAGLRAQLENAVQQGDVDAVRAVIAGLDEVQSRLQTAAGVGIDPPPNDTLVDGNDTVADPNDTLVGGNDTITDPNDTLIGGDPNDTIAPGG